MLTMISLVSLVFVVVMSLFQKRKYFHVVMSHAKLTLLSRALPSCDFRIFRDDFPSSDLGGAFRGISCLRGFHDDFHNVRAWHGVLRNDNRRKTSSAYCTRPYFISEKNCKTKQVNKMICMQNASYIFLKSS